MVPKERPAGSERTAGSAAAQLQHPPRADGAVFGWTLANFIGRPQFIAYQNRPRPLTVRLASLLGAVKVVWTVRDEADRPRVEGENEMVIFEFYRPAPKFKQ